MEKNDHTFHYQQDFPLESGDSLPGFQLRYTTLGKLNADRNNVVWICHALTGSSDFTDWWSGLFDEGRFFDPHRYFIICANVLGGCYGSTGPLSLNPKTGKPYYHSFPAITNRDAVHAFDLLRQELRLDFKNTVEIEGVASQHLIERDLGPLGAMQLGIGIDAANPGLDLAHVVGEAGVDRLAEQGDAGLGPQALAEEVGRVGPDGGR